MAEIDLLIGVGAGADDEADAIPEAAPGTPPVSRLGDLWLCGPHRVICGDATDPEAVAALHERRAAQMVFTDPPYNVPIDGHVGGLGKVKHREFAMASGEMSPAEFTAFLTTAFGSSSRISVDGSIHFICMDWRHIGEMLAAGRAAYSRAQEL